MFVQATPAQSGSAHVIVLGNEKGGSGKSTTALHVAVALLKAGQRVATIDLDSRQKSFTHYIENRRDWSLVNFDERMQAFRFHHLKLAQRIIGGDVVGTMGTPVEVLQQRMARGVLYKALWDVRNEITSKMNAATSQDSKGHGRY